jgi:hypothetical protein
MALKLSSANGSYLWPVSIDVPVDGGRYEKLSFDAKFRRIPQDRTEALTLLAVKNAQQLQMGQEPEKDGTDRAVAEEVLEGWAGVIDDDGEEVPFSTTALQSLLVFPGAASAIVLAWYDSINGKKAKN